MATVLPSPAPSDEPSPIQPRTESPAAEIPSEPMYQAPPQLLPQPQQAPQQVPQQASQQQSSTLNHASLPAVLNPSRPQNQENHTSNGAHSVAHAQLHNKRKRTM